MKAHQRRINFLDPDTLEAAALAKAGISNSSDAMKRTGLTVGQITRRVNIMRDVEKPSWYRKGISYRRAWTLGLSRESREYLKHVLPGIRREVERTIPQQLVHPTPKIIEMDRAA